MAPSLKSVHDAGMIALNQRNSPWTINTDQWFSPAEKLKALFAKIIGADKENIALVPSASYGIAIAMRNIELLPNQKIILLDQQYPSNVYAWRELSSQTGAIISTVIREKNQSWTEALLAHIDNDTGLVAIPNCHWTDGGLIDLETVNIKVKELGAKFVIDASQSIGAYPFDVSKVQPDFLVTVGYKWLLGAYGLSYLYVNEKYFEKGTPLEYSWLK